MNNDFFPGDIFDGHYRLLDELSADGGTADVWLALDLNTIDSNLGDDDEAATPDQLEETGLKVAIKIYRPKNALDIEGEQRFRDEFKIVFNCHHGNLIQPTHFSIWQGIPYLVLPFCAHGSSELLIGNLSDKEHIWKYIADVSGGLAYLHSRRPPIVHQDIKPANVLIDDDFNYAITDFGISSTLGQRDLYDFASGTLAYMSPERFAEGDVPQPSSDVYAFGATLYELITGRVPFGENGGSEQPDGPVKLDYGDHAVPADVVRLIAVCLDKDPAKRPTADAIHQAALAQTFPYNPRRGRALKIAAFAVAAVLLAALGVMLWQRQGSQGANGPAPQQVKVDPKQRFEQAMAMAQNNSRDSIVAAFDLLDSIATHCNYMPAYYEIARTYGMVFEQDSAKYNRLKRALGVELGNINALQTINRLRDAVDLSGYDQNMPKKIEHNNKANNACLMILSQDSPDYRHEAMDAAWIMGCYSMLCTNDKAEAIKYFELCRKAAQDIGDDGTASIADSYIQALGQLSLTK
ncbi:MAG: serine/threonine protein kinase [Muribaculaceae bacterium]|nr:serine/threonine protein kinase [Muribaculaceae bacterium]